MIDDDLQQACVEVDPSSPLIVVAGPGSGKTHVLCKRIEYLVATNFVKEEQVLCVTFTNKAAKSMQVRVSRMLDREHGCRIMTIHALGLSIVKERYAELGYEKPVKTASEAERNLIFEKIRVKLDFESADGLDKVVDGIKSGQKAFLHHEMYGYEYKKAATIYTSEMKAAGLCDFNDMVGLPLSLFKQNETVRKEHAQRFAHILIDEFQDTSNDQWELLKLLVGENTGVTVVGDVNQSIYGFRGANPKVFERFHDAFPDTAIRSLEKNYRCTADISRVANNLIRNNIYYETSSNDFTAQLSKMQAELNLGGSSSSATRIDPGGFSISKHVSPSQEAWSVVELIHKIVTCEREKTVAILCRNHEPLTDFKKRLEEVGIDFVSKISQPLAQNAVVQDVFALLYLVSNSSDISFFKRILNKPHRSLKPNDVIQLLSTSTPDHLTSVYEKLNHISLYGVQSPRADSKKARQTQGSLLQFKGFDRLAMASTVEQDSKKKTPGRRASETDRTLASLRNIHHMLSSVKKIAASGSVPKVIEYILNETGYGKMMKEKWGKSKKKTSGEVAVEQILTYARTTWKPPVCEDKIQNLKNFCDHVVISGLEGGEEEGKAPVTLTTIHGGKGLEWDFVFLVRCNESVMPGTRLNSVPKLQILKNISRYEIEPSPLYDMLKEERRLCYVAMTRAIQYLSISYVASVPEFIPSQFIDEISVNFPYILRGTEPTVPLLPPPPPSREILDRSAVPLVTLSCVAAVVFMQEKALKSDGVLTAIITGCLSHVAAKAALAQEKLLRRQRRKITRISMHGIVVLCSVVGVLSIPKRKKQSRRLSNGSAGKPAKKRASTDSNPAMQGMMSKWLKKAPKKCPDDILLPEIQSGYTGSAKYKKKSVCEVCSKDFPFSIHKTHCENCLAEIDQLLYVSFTIDGAAYEDDVEFIASKAVLDTKLKDALKTRAPSSFAKALLKTSRSLLWSALWHYGSINDIQV